MCSFLLAYGFFCFFDSPLCSTPTPSLRKASASVDKEDSDDWEEVDNLAKANAKKK